MSRRNPAPTIYLTVRPGVDGQVAFHMHHPDGFQSILVMDALELDDFEDVLAEARRLARGQPMKTRVTVSLHRK